MVTSSPATSCSEGDTAVVADFACRRKGLLTFVLICLRVRSRFANRVANGCDIRHDSTVWNYQRYMSLTNAVFRSYGNQRYMMLT
jgi:hypothetical protein